VCGVSVICVCYVSESVLCECCVFVMGKSVSYVSVCYLSVSYVSVQCM